MLKIGQIYKNKADFVCYHTDDFKSLNSLPGLKNNILLKYNTVIIVVDYKRFNIYDAWEIIYENNKVAFIINYTNVFEYEKWFETIC